MGREKGRTWTGAMDNRGRRAPRRASSLLPRLFLSLAALIASASAGAGEPGGDAPVARRPDEVASARSVTSPGSTPVRIAIDRALRFLKAKQEGLGSGTIGGRYPVAATSLAGLAVLGAGHREEGGPYGEMLRRALQFLKEVGQGGDPAGYLSEEKSRMHGHCYAVLFLTQIYGELGRERQVEVGRLIRGGIKVIEVSQSGLGGWYYSPINNNNEDEASITICALQALRAANEIGFLVPKSRIDRAVDYVKKCKADDGSFRYSLSMRGSHTSYALTVAAVSTLHAAGAYDAPEAKAGLDFARKVVAGFPSDPLKAAGREFHYYANLYAAQAFHQAGGELWISWYDRAAKKLLERQAADGSWSDDYGPEIGTAMAALILEVPLDYLPIFQR
jgi:hypothetical protein